MKFNQKITEFIQSLDFESIPNERKEGLSPLVSFIQSKKDKNEPIHLNFICTHNSRRSQFSQIWAHIAGIQYELPVHSYSGGVEVTAFNERAVKSLERTGFIIQNPGGENPHYIVQSGNEANAIEMWSKLYDDETSADESFAAIMTCAHADENCPLILGADERIPVRFEDPKAFDDTDREEEMYDTRSKQIATEYFYAFSLIK